jgi:hypothetical protein
LTSRHGMMRIFKVMEVGPGLLACDGPLILSSAILENAALFRANNCFLQKSRGLSAPAKFPSEFHRHDQGQFD